MGLRIFTYPSDKGEKFLQKLINRAEEFPEKIEKEVRKIGKEVLKKGDRALKEFTKKFDGVLIEDFKVGEEEIEKAYEEVSEELLEAIRYGIERIRSFHERGKPESWFEWRDGIFRGQVVRAVERAGLYIPGGKGGETPLISTVLMTAVPAKIAGAEKVVMVSPPRKEGGLHPALLVAGKEAGVDEIYKVGGPWSIFALAYGTESIPKVDVICGPGNIYVTVAKKLVSAFTGIDIIAGPSEVLIVADESADPEFVVWDLFAQAEHDPMSLPLLITTSEELAEEVKELAEKLVKEVPRKEIVENALFKKGGILVVEDIGKAIELANLIAPEHLELMVKKPVEALELVRNAGAVFLGSYTPEAMGDYIAGPNHVLPTMGFARFCSSLSVDKFLKKVNFLKYSEEALLKDAEKVMLLAEKENLFCHAEAVRIRVKKLR
jgi:histidinol dehydrogenase